MVEPTGPVNNKQDQDYQEEDIDKLLVDLIR
jgi:hypothetical protein